MTPAHSPEHYKRVVYSLTNLPTLPIIAGEILRITRDDNFSVRQMLPVLEKDPPLAMKVLKTANSAFYGLRNRVESLGQAIVVIGMDELSHLALGFTILNVFGKEKDGHGLAWGAFWKHSITCGHINQFLTKRLKLSYKGSPYAFGLMHDVGKLIMHRIDPESFAAAVQRAESEFLSSVQAEKDVFGVTHQEMGKWVTDRWQLPESFSVACGNHHEPDLLTDPDQRLMAALIQVADHICNLIQVRFGSGISADHFDGGAGWGIIQSQVAQLHDVGFEQFVESIQDEIKSIEKTVIESQLLS